jgi:hypothetical protein
VRAFRRRAYAGPGALARDLRALLRQRGAVREVLAGRGVGPVFRERLSLLFRLSGGRPGAGREERRREGPPAT